MYSNYNDSFVWPVDPPFEDIFPWDQLTHHESQCMDSSRCVGPGQGATRPYRPTALPRRLSRRSDVQDDDLGREAFEMLPPLGEAIWLCDTSLEHGAYLLTTLQRTGLLDEAMEAVYRAGSLETLRSHPLRAGPAPRPTRPASAAGLLHRGAPARLPPRRRARAALPVLLP
ncbi:hypothetical protein FB451DRAFT_678751 [Mycena latifolia]|nr:hypothetical protein FB451DRAFT_678751 [Mycena latifolia]